jgi:hypothetical protein
MDKLKWRITAFFFGGVINGILGLYVIVSGASFLPPDTARMLAIVFLVFTAVDFYFVFTLKKRLRAEIEKRAPGAGPQPRS